MKRFCKRLFAALLSATLVVGNLPAHVTTVKAAVGDQIVLDLCRPTTGVISNRTADQVGGDFVVQGISGAQEATAESRTYTVTSSLAGTNWRLNTSRTIPALASGATSYPTGNTGIQYFKWHKSTSQWGGDERTVLYVYGKKTLAFDFDVATEQAGQYTVSLVYYDSSNPRTLNINLNAGKENAFSTVFPAVTTAATNKKVVAALDGTATLTAGTNTLDIVNPSTSAGQETMIRAIVLTKVADAGATPTLAPTDAPTPTPTDAPSGAPVDPSLEPFSVSISTTDTATVTKIGSNYYFNASTKGANWAVHSSTASNVLTDGTTTSNITRLFLESGAPSRAALYRKSADLVFSFTAPKAGYYDMDCDVYWHSNAGYADIYVNDVKVGTLDGNAGSGVNNQKLSNVYLKEGELANTLKIKATGISTGAYHYFLWQSFNFVPPGYVAPSPTPVPTAAPTPVPTLAPTATPMPTEDPNAVKEPFSVAIDTTDLTTAYTANNADYYFTKDTKGANWAVHSSTSSNILMSGTSTSNVTRIFTSGGVGTRAAMFRKSANLVFSFTAPASGYYDLASDVYWHENGGYADIYINDIYVGTLDANKGSGTNEQKLLGVYLNGGTLANTLKIRTTGVSTGGYHYFLWKDFHFTTPETIATLKGIAISLDENADIFVGDEVSAAAYGDLTNGGLYRFSSVGAGINYTSSNETVATISSDGMLTALTPGTTIITATAPSLGYTDSITITVKEVVYDTAEINIAENQALVEGDTFELETKAKLNNGAYADADKVTTVYESSNDAIAKVEDGVLYALTPGTVVITAHVTYEGKTLDVARTIVVEEFVPPVAFEVRIKGYKNATESGSNRYLSLDSYGANWKVSPKTDAPLATSSSDLGNCRIFDSTVTYLTLYKKGKTFVFDVDVPLAGKYDITANVIRHTSGGYAAVYVNDVYVGTIDSYNKTTITSSTLSAPLLGVKLLKGSNTIAVKVLGASGGSGYYSMFSGFTFSTPEEIATITGIDAVADVENMYVGREEQISIDAILSNGGYYDFAQSTETFTYESSDTSVATVSSKGVITGKGAGEATITVTAVNGGWSDTITFDVSDAAYEKVEMNVTEGETIYVTNERALEVVATLADGTEISQNDLTVVYTSDNEAAAKIENGVLKAVAKGNATITATATFKVDGTTKTDVKHITVTTIPLKGITGVTVKPAVQELDKDGVQFIVQGVAEDDTVIEDLVVAGFTSFDFTYTSLNPELLTIDENGICRYVSRGVAQVQVDAVIDGVSFSTVVEVVSSSAKRGRTIYTEEMVANAMYNAANTTWGVKGMKSLGGSAFQYVYSLDSYYELIPAEGVPRSYQNATLEANIDVRDCCPSCGVNVDEVYGDWACNVLEKPWKIWCPQCRTVFPTNDFGLLYSRGLDENGEYNRDLAVQRNAEAVARGEKDALVNELYPEKGATWMVDDGFGWSPTSGTYGTQDLIQHAPAAKYMYMLWNTGNHSITTALDRLMRYYLYSGREEFGHAGAILLDRVADVYPSFDVTKVNLNYHASHGGAYSGKITGSIAEEGVAEVFLRAYDAFYPLYDDPEVIAFLSAKAAEKGLDNPKTNGNLIRENIENGIVREVMDALYSAKIYGNFGYHQKTAALAAVALDTQPETNDMLVWLRSPSTVVRQSVVDPVFGKTYNGRKSNSGGEMATKYANEIDRDGFGAEVSFGYNVVWAQGIQIAEILKNYGTDILDLYKDPKFVNMFDSFIHLTAGNGYSMQWMGDGGTAGSGGFYVSFRDEAISGYDLTRDPVLAQIYYHSVNGDLNTSALGYFRNVRELSADIRADIAEHGEYTWESENLTGYGLGIVRGGKAATKENQYETRYDTWMYYGRTTGSHAHLDMLAIGLDAYGFNFLPDLGAPAFKGNAAERVEWINTTLAHNTVTIDEMEQNPVYTGTPLHFDVTDNVKLIDTESPKSYDEIDIYRRTVVTIAANEDVSYTLDFFRVKGGNQHTYSLHSSSYQHTFTDDIDFVPQMNEKGEFAGTYAGVDVPFGPDPNSTDANASSSPMYPRGYTWLKEVKRGTDKTNDGLFTIKFEQTDFNNQVVDSGGLALKVHAINDWTADSIDVATGLPSSKAANEDVLGYDYLLIQRKGENLDTLFTTLLEPFKVDDYIQKAEPIATTIVSGTEGENDIAKAVKVTLKNGRTDYVIYATNKNVTYHVTDGNVSFDFAGFVGVYSVDFFGNNIYSYVNDGTLIGNVAGIGAYTGTVVDFTKEYVIDDYITIKTEQPVEDASIFTDKYIYVNNTAKSNGAFRILSAELKGENVELYLGNCSLVQSYKDSNNLDEGFNYTIAEGQTFYIPMTATDGEAFGGSQRPANSGGSGSAGVASGATSGAGDSTDATATEDSTEVLTEAEQEAIDIENEMLYDNNNPTEGSDDAPEDLAEATPAPTEDQTGSETGDGTPTPDPDAANVNAGGKGVRNILLGGLGILALLAGIFFIILGKKKDEDEEA